MSKYDYGMELPENGSIRWGYDSIPENSKVLEMGCAEGLLTRHLKKIKNCTIDIVEINEEAGKVAAEFADTALLGDVEGDLEKNDWLSKLEGNEYDVITFMDVLEHLRNPEEVLKKASSLLKDSGFICLTVPNIGHNSVLINLINNKFEYQDLGILDNTHIRFFCQDTLEQMIRSCGLVAVKKTFTQAPVGEAFIENSYEDINGSLAQNLHMRENGEIVQFLYQLRKDNGYEEGKLEYEIGSCKLYYDLGEGFNEENTIIAKYVSREEKVVVSFDTSRLSNVKQYRWDPIEKAGMAIEIESFKVASKRGNVAVEMLPNNAICSTEQGDIFATSDPSYTIKGNVEDIQAIEIKAILRVIESKDVDSVSVLLETKDNAIMKTKQEKAQVEKEKKQVEQEKAQVEQEKAQVEQEKAQVEQEKAQVEQEKAQVEQEKAQVELEKSVIQQELDRVNIARYEAIAEHDRVVHSYNEIRNSFFWRATKPFRRVMDFSMKIPVFRRAVNCIKSVKNNELVEKIEEVKAIPDSRFTISLEERQAQLVTKFDKKIKFSIVVPLYNTPLEFLTEMIESVQNQTYTNWELCLADGSTDEYKYVRKICKMYAKKDRRIKYKKLKENQGISGNTNECVKMTTGDYIGLFDHDDLLHESALYFYMQEICDNDVEFLYCDELTFEGEVNNVITIHHKPDFAIDNLRANNYICHFTVFKKSLITDAIVFRKEYDGSQDHDMVLRLTEKAERIAHVPMVLYFWRSHPGSVASDINSKTYAIQSGKNAVRDHLKRCGYNVTVESTRAFPTIYKINYEIKEQPLVSIIIPNKDGKNDLEKCVNSIIDRVTYDNYEIIIVENNSVEEDIFEYYKSLEEEEKIKVVFYEETGGDFNYPDINNYGTRFAKGEQLLFLNNDTEVITPEFIEKMLMYSMRPDVGAVGAKLFYEDDTIQHAGIILGMGANGCAGHCHYKCAKENLGYMGRLCYAQNLSAVTAACLMVKANIYREVKGFNRELAVAYNDVDFCLRIREKGYNNVWTPFAKLYHHESKTRALDVSSEKKARLEREASLFRNRWKTTLEKGDPYFNPNFSLEHSDFRIK